MRLVTGLSIAVVVLATPLCARAQGADGTWKLSYVTAGTTENAAAIVRIKDGKGELVAGAPRFKALTLNSVKQEKDTLRISLQLNLTELVFETSVPAAGAKQTIGSMSADGTLYPASIETTTDATIEGTGTRKLDCPPFEEAKKLTLRVTTLRNQIAFSKDAEKKKDLAKQLVEADALAKKETPRLYRETVAKHADSPAVFDAVLTLIKGAAANDAKPDEIANWAKIAANAAKKYGPRYQTEITSQLADVLLRSEGNAKAALEYARLAEIGVTASTSDADQARVLGVVVRALRANGMEADANATEARAEKFETILDKAYSAKMPGFTGMKFTGRKAKSDRAVFMELFTGATCPPCVAADLAFDVLQKTYTPSELVLIQYHMHIPGPDPMTNADTEGRWAYYRKAYPKQVGGVPSSLFNGKPAAGGGGGVANAEAKYQKYREVIEPLLEEAAAAKLTANAVRKGDRVDINVNVDFGAPGADKRLRVLLAEETVRYLGSNKIRLHHNVVRVAPGGFEGKALADASSKHAYSVQLNDLRSQLTKYLDNYEATSGRSFLNPARPMAMNNLKLIAFVQDDNTHEILQAVQVEVERK